MTNQILTYGHKMNDSHFISNGYDDTFNKLFLEIFEILGIESLE